jgi:hypothetical protein
MTATQSDTETFEREPIALAERITSDESSLWPVEPGRYRLVVARACPWANRSVIVRRLLGLEPVLSTGIAGPLHDERSWRFHLDPGNRDPVLGIEYLRVEDGRDVDSRPVHRPRPDPGSGAARCPGRAVRVLRSGGRGHARPAVTVDG